MTENNKFKFILMDNRRAEQILRPNVPEFNEVVSFTSLRKSLNERDSKASDIRLIGTRVNYSQLNMGIKMQKTLITNEIDLKNIFNEDSNRLPLDFFYDFNYDELFDHAKDNLMRNSALAFIPDVYDKVVSSLKLSRMSFKSTANDKIEHSNDWVEVQIVNYNENYKLFQVIDEINFEEHHLPSIKINFWNENAQMFVDRVKRAIENRENCEKRIKYELMLDCIPINGMPSMPEQLKQRIIKNMEVNDAVKKMMEEINLHYKRCQVEIQLQFKGDFESFTNKDVFYSKTAVNLNYDYKVLRQNVNFKSIYCQPEVFISILDVAKSCADLSCLCLFSIEKSTETTIEDFDKAQETKIVEITDFLQNEWPDNVAQNIITHLKKQKIGWFDLRINNWEVYQISKLLRFMMLVRYKMQEAIQAFIVSSIQEYICWLCEPCVSTLTLPEDFEWGEDLINSPFYSEFPVFHLILHMKESVGTYFSSDIDLFEQILLQHFDTALLNTHFVKLIDPIVLQKLLYEPGLCLSSIGLMDERITKPRNYLEKCYRQAVIPLKAYASRYNDHLGFFVMHNETYVKEFKEANYTMLEIKDELLKNIRTKQILEETLPDNIVIGPFFILVHPLKAFLIKKYADLIQKLMVMLNELIRDKTMVIVLEYRDMYNRLFDAPPSVEFLFETQTWMDALPELVKATEEQMRLILFDYDILDFFQYALSNDDCALKWEGLRWPNKIISQINVTREAQIIEVEKFQKEQVSETTYFDKTLETLTVQVQEYQFKDDPSKASVNAKNCSKLSEQLLVTQKLGKTLNDRQLLFELPELELESIKQLITSFKPYKTLWYTAANFYRKKDEWMNEKLFSLKVHDIFESIENSKNIFLELVDDFKELPKIQEVPNFFLTEIRNFEPILDLMQDLTHFCWNFTHYKMLNKQTGMKIFYSNELSTHMCVEEGIMDHRETVKNILKTAIDDHLQQEKTKQAETERHRKEEEILEARRQRRLARTDI